MIGLKRLSVLSSSGVGSAKAKGIRIDGITIALGAACLVLAIIGWIYMVLMRSTVSGLLFLGTADLLLTADYLRPHSQPTRLDSVVLMLEYFLFFALFNLYFLTQLGNAVVHDLATKEPIHNTIQKPSP